MADIEGPEYYRGHPRKIAQRLKDPYDREAREVAAPAIASLITEERPVLVPAPSSDGTNPTNEYLAAAVMHHLKDAVVRPVIKRTASVPSSTMLRRSGKRGLTAAEHVPSLTQVMPLPPDRPVVVLDNVATTGATIHAMEYVLGVPVHGVVYAVAAGARGREAREVPKEEPSMGARRRAPKKRRRSRARRPRLCVTGSRDYAALERIGDYLQHVPRDVIIVHGGARGVDQEAHWVAEELGFDIEVALADWERYGRAAGPIRNREMVSGCDHVVAFWNGVSRGTESAIHEAQVLGMEVDIIPDYGLEEM